MYWRDQHSAGARAQFTTACSAIRRSALLAVGMFNEWHYHARLEDVELGYRLAEMSHETVLVRGIQVTHLKTWTLGEVLHDSWARNLLHARCLTFKRSRTVARTEMVHALSSVGAFAVAVSSAFPPAPSRQIMLSLALVIVLVMDRGLYGFFLRRKGIMFALATVPVHVATRLISASAICAGWLLRHAIGDPAPDATTQAFAEVGVDVWPPVRRRR